MSASSINYIYTGILGLNTGNLVLLYDFNSGNNIINNSGSYSQCSGQLTSIGNFYNIPTSGYLSGQRLDVQNSAALNSNNFTHIMLYEKPNQHGGVLFDSIYLGSDNVVSGYTIGVTDSNQLYYEAYDNNGPVCVVSSLTFGVKNAAALTRSNNSLSFYVMDFNNNLLLSEQFSINAQYMPPSNKASLFATGANCPNYIYNNFYSGYIGEYIYLNNAALPYSIQQLISGFVVSYSGNNGIIASYSITGVTGLSYIVTGTTGILAQKVTPLTSGIDNCGNSYVTYSTQNITGYITSGSGVIQQTGLITVYETGAAIVTPIINSGLFNEFKLNRISYLRKIDHYDVTQSLLLNNNYNTLNNFAVFDSVNNMFILNAPYPDTGVQIYLNGQAQFNMGAAITGNFYGSGYNLSGDYIINNNSLNSNNYYNATDALLYDVINASKNFTIITNPSSGAAENLNIDSGSLVFLNGQLINSGLEYKQSGNKFVWNVNYNVTGYLEAFEIYMPNIYGTGALPINGNFPRDNSMIWLNGQRQTVGTDYIEGSTSDLIGQSGNYWNNLNLIYGDTADYFNQ